MEKEEYIFLNKKYENAVTAIKAHLFDVISNEEIPVFLNTNKDE